ncbi:MAG: glycerol kinase [Burkholderiales bacterium]|nr:MAG: glycerol kinase [Burkholderiales bacterium]
MPASSATDRSPCILALDQGTTSSRAILFDRLGQVCGTAQQEFAQIFPRPGWVEHRPQDLWQSQLAVARQVLAEQGVEPSSLAGIGITNQRETTLLWDRRTSEPVGPAIVWQDRRTASRCEQLLADGHADLIRDTTGLVIDAYFSATKLAWLLDHVPGARERAQRGELAFGTVDTWLLWQLTGGRVHATDPGNASRTLLFNIHTLSWDPALLDLFGIPASVLPAVMPSSGVMGHTDVALLGASLPIAGVAGDQQAATFGQACHRPGMAKNTYGTGCFMLMNTGDQAAVSRHRLLSTVGWTAAGRAATYCLEGSVFMAGATVQWLRDGLQIIERSADVEALAASVEDTGDVYLVPAFAGLGAPHWDGHARAALLGMTRGTGRAHVARAALEAIALQSAEVFAAMEADAGMPVDQLRVDGGASANNLLMQLQADVLGVPVVRPRVTETTALGAAYLAGLATGVWRDVDEIAALWQVDRVFEPAWSGDRRQAKRERWRQAVERAGHWARD